MAKTNDHSADLGRFGQHLSNLIADVVVKVRAGTVDAEHDARVRANVAFLEDMERELAPMLDDLLTPLLNHAGLSDEHRRFLDEMTNPTHFVNPILQIVAFIGWLIAIIPALGQVEVRDEIYGLNLVNTNIPLSPADAADMIARQTESTLDPYHEAAKTGVGHDVLFTMAELVGEPPGPIDMLSLWRRGLIDQDYLEEAIRYSRIKNKYVPQILQLAHSYVGTAEVVNLAIKGVVDLATAKKMYSVAGGIEDQFEMVYEAAGDAIGNEQALMLYNHGEATKDEVYQVFGRSRMNPLFYDLAFKLRKKFLNVTQIEAVLRTGQISPDVALQWMLADGYSKEEAQALVTALSAGKVAKPKAETEAMVITAFERGLLDASQAQAQLQVLGYPATAAQLMVNNAQAKIAHAQMSRVERAIQHRYLIGRLTDQEAVADLVRLGVPHSAATQWVNDWGVEKQTRTKSLTDAQIGTAYHKGALSADQALARWEADGYSAADAAVLLAIHGGPPPAGSPAAGGKQ
jgi:hypothetical protein